MWREVKDKEQIEALLTLFASEFSTFRDGTRSAKEMAEKLSQNGTVLLLEQETVIAFAAFYANDQDTKKAFLSMIAVTPSHKRMGYGRKMLQEVEKYSKEKGMEILRLEVQKENKGARALYKKEGFLEQEETETSIYMEKKLEN